MNIGLKTIERAAEIVAAMMKIHQPSIDKAFLKADDALNVSLGVKFKPAEAKDQVEIDVSIKFVTDQVKDSATALFNENQAELFPKEKKPKGKPDNGWFSLPKQWPCGATLLAGLKPFYPRKVPGPRGMVTAYFPAN